MARDLVGLLTGIEDTQNPVAVPGSENFYGQFMANRNRAVQQGLGSLMRGGEPSAQENRQRAMIELSSPTTADGQTKPLSQQIADLTKMAKVLQVQGNSAAAGQAAAKIEQLKVKQAESQQRIQLISQANKLGLEATAEMLKAGGPLKSATEQIFEAEERNVIAKQGRNGRVEVARSKGAAQPVLDAIKKGNYDNLSDTLFLETISGEKADLKVYQQTIDGRSVSKPFRVNEAGQVWDASTEKWVMASELGLTQAPVTTKTLSAGDGVTKQLTQGFVDSFVELNELGRQAEKMLEINRASALDLDKIYTGKLAPVQLAIMDIGKALGVISPEQEDAVVATQTFMINRAKQVLPLIKALGSGTAISDKDREFIEKVVAGDISLSLDTIKRVIEIENEYAVKAISKSNLALDRLSNIKGADIDPNVVEGLYITAPTFTPSDDEGLSPAAQSVIERARQRTQRNTGIR